MSLWHADEVWHDQADEVWHDHLDVAPEQGSQQPEIAMTLVQRAA